MIGLEVEFTGIAAELSLGYQRNMWRGTRPFGRAARAAYGKALQYWHEKILPRHFNVSKQDRYTYQKRKKPYLRIKARLADGLPVRGRGGQRIRGRESRVIEGGHTDIVRSGQTKRKSQKGAIIRAYPKYGRATIQVPQYIVRCYKSDRPDMKAEIKKITPAEKQKLVEVAEFYFTTVLMHEARRARKRKLKIPQYIP